MLVCLGIDNRLAQRRTGKIISTLVAAVFNIIPQVKQLEEKQK